MPDAILNTAFDPFTSQSPSNLGLGLHVVVNRISNVLRGEIYCENNDENGCTLVAIFPQNPTENIEPK